MLRPFQVHRPSTPTEASALLREHGPAAAPYAGGTELLLAMKEGLLAPEHLVDVKALDLAHLRVDPGSGALRAGAATPHRWIERSELVARGWPVLAEMERGVANVRVRNQGTIGGNLCFNEPHADPGTVLVLLDAVVTLHGGDGTRQVPVADFLVDAFVTSRAPDELLTEVLVPAPPERSGSAFVKFGMLERPSANAAALVVLDGGGERVAEARIAVGAAGTRPLRVPEAEEAVTGEPVAAPAFGDATAAAGSLSASAAEAGDDLYGSAEYKRHLVDVLVRRALRRARERALAGTAGR